MQMWAVSNLPVYTVDKGTADKKSRTHSVGGSDDSETALLQPPAPSLIRPVPFSSDVTPWDDAVINSSNNNNNNNNNNNDNFDALLEPALDAPPSPESIRKQMQRASARDKHHSHATSSSGSASLRSLTSADRPSWENVLEAGRLSRKSSGRSTSSSMPAKDRPESVQFFGRNLFNRRARLRRESSAQSSASSSVYGGEMGGEPPMPPPTSIPTNRDSTIPSLFGRRRASKQEQASKFQISGPYNFQHVTHTQKDSLPDLQRTNRQVLAAEFAQVRASQVPADGSLKGIKAQNLHFDNFSSESLSLGEEEVIGGLTEPVARSILTRPPSGILKHSPRRLLKRSQSQDQLSIIPPPRPPRSPIEADAPYPPIPPPRTSSRMGSRHERFDSINPNFRYPQPFPLLADAGSPPPTSYGYVPGPDMDVIPEHSHSTHSKTPSMDDPNWPLPCSSTATLETPLPEVPEEEEETFVPKKSRASIASNSSLRGSVSVPMLRAFSLRKNGDLDRRGSEASDTLGCFDLAAAQRAVEEALNESGDGLIRDSWEDDIDYAYDHEVEADCDYEWHRPSFELSRDSATPVGQSCEVSPTMLLAAQFDVPALSPVSQLSTATAQEAITPTAVTSNIPASLNFSLPKVESKNLLHVRKLSDASSFKESHGFTLSPSLLIPMDFQQQMMAHEADHEFSYRHFDDTAHRYRTSASTTHTLESVHSGFEKHISTASTSTDFTRLTPSTTSLDTDNYPLKPEPLQRFPSFESNRADAIGAMPTLPESEETLQPSTRRREFRSRGSESSLLKLATDEPWPGKAKNSIQARRGRARTTSLSTPPPPNQYTLFPSVQLTGNRI